MDQSEVCGCAVLELRQYTLRPGGRDILLDLFERHFHRGLEACGMHVLGEFRDLADEDRFVWIRGFESMAAREQALTDFYLKSRVWREHREAANATMVDSDDVLLLRPLGPRSRFRLPGPATRPARSPLVVATIYSFDRPVTEDFVELFEDRIVPVLNETGGRVLGYLETEPAENTFPQLPVREGENVFVWLASFDGPDAFRSHLDRLDQHEEWSVKLLPALTRHLATGPQRLMLEPTAFSALR